MYQLQRQFYACSFADNRDMLKKYDEKFLADIKRLEKQSVENLRINEEKITKFEEKCKSIYQRCMWRTEWELDHFKKRETRRSENRRAKRLRKKQRQAEAKKVAHGIAEDEVNEE